MTLSHRRYRQWRARFMAAEPLCRRCAAKGFTVAAVELHHIVPRATAPERTMDPSNVEPVCRECHLQVTATDFGFAPPSSLLPDAAAWDARLERLR